MNVSSIINNAKLEKKAVAWSNPFRKEMLQIATFATRKERGFDANPVNWSL